MALPPLNVKIGADDKGLEAGLLKASRNIDGFQDKTKAMAINFAKVAATITVAAAAIGAGILKAANEAAKAGVEINNLANVAGIGTTEFQRLAAASQTVGIEQGKLSDILKDVNDKFGDFQATGAGPLADFFENIAPLVGVTADQFARLSGPDALQLYVSSLEQAGVSQQQMTFYLEALASDTTALIPLLRNGGLAMRQLGDEAERSGRILDQEAIAGAVELDRKLQELSDTLKINATRALLEYSDELIELVDIVMERVLPALVEMGTWFFNLAEDIGSAIGKVNEFVTALSGIPLFGEGVDPGVVTGGFGGPGLNPESLTPYGRELLGMEPLAPEDDPRFVGPIAPMQIGVGAGIPPVANNGAGPRRRESGGGGSGLSSAEELAEELAERLEVLTEGLMTESETVANWFEESRQTLTEALEAELLTQAEYKEQMARLEEEHQARIHGIKKMGAAADLALVLGAGQQILEAMGQTNEKALQVARVFGAAQALISTYQGAAEALKLPFPANLAAAASVISAGIGFVSSIKSVTKGGGGGSGVASPSIGAGGAVGGGGGGGAGQDPTTTFAFTLQNDPMGFGESFARQMIEQLNRAQRDGGRIQAVLT